MGKPRNLVIALVGVGMAAAAVATSAAAADVTVTGKADAIELTANQSTVKAALERLSSTFGLELHGVDDLNDPLTGTFKGPLSTVVDQLLGTHNHFMRPNGSGQALFVIDTQPVTPAAAPQAGADPAAGDPVRAQAEKTITLSPEGQEMAVKMFGEKGRYLQIDETLLRSFFTGRGGRRFVQPPQ